MDYLTVNVVGGKTFRQDIAAEVFNIGRSSQNELVLEDPGVSRAHARIARFAEGYFLLDAGGKNGTYINERRIDAPTLLRAGDVIRVGSTSLIFNGTTSSPVEFVDVPLPVGPATTFLPVRETVTPSGAFLRSASSMETDPAARVAKLGSSSGPSTAPAVPSLGSAALNIIWEADKELVFHHPVGEILERIVDLVGKAVPFDRGLLMLLEDGRLTPRVVRVPPGEEGKKIAISQTIADRVMQKQESVLTADALADERFREGHSVVAQQIRSAMCVPLWNNRDVIGLIYIDSRRRAGLFNEEHLRLLAHLANVAAVKIENALLFEQRIQSQRMEEELKKAWEIQKILLPAESPPIPGYQLHGDSAPCRVVGGDLYDYIDLPGGRYALVLGDVAGKGYSAALLMCAFQASLRALCELDLPPEETMERLNRHLVRRFPDNRFVTFFYGLLDPERHVLTYVNAGHCPPWLVHRGAPPERLAPTGGPLGMFEKMTYTAEQVTLEPGDVLLCYSDGVTEGVNAAGDEFGETKLVDIVARCSESSPRIIIDAINAEIEAYHQGRAREDDITLVVLQRAA